MYENVSNPTLEFASVVLDDDVAAVRTQVEWTCQNICQSILLDKKFRGLRIEEQLQTFGIGLRAVAYCQIVMHQMKAVRPSVFGRMCQSIRNGYDS